MTHETQTLITCRGIQLEEKRIQAEQTIAFNDAGNENVAVRVKEDEGARQLPIRLEMRNVRRRRQPYDLDRQWQWQWQQNLCSMV